MMPVYYVLIAIVAVFWLGRQYGIVEGQRRREARIEQQRAIEVKTLLEHIGLTWHRK